MQHHDTYRKKPVQPRSETTVEVIFEASAQILETRGLDAFTTNAIAKLAGVSIGTLYQYFPNKKSILIAMAQRELDKASQSIIKNIGSGVITDDTELGRSIVRSLIQAFGGRQRMRKVMIEALIANGLSDELTRPVENVIKAIISQHSQPVSEHVHMLPAIGMYVMTRAMIGTIRSAVMEQSIHLNTVAFEDELVRLFLCCWRSRSDP